MATSMLPRRKASASRRDFRSASGNIQSDLAMINGRQTEKTRMDLGRDGSRQKVEEKGKKKSPLSREKRKEKAE